MAKAVVLTEYFHGIPQYLKANFRIVAWNMPRKLPNSLYFTV